MKTQLDLFEDQYRTLDELREMITQLHWTGGINPDGTLQYIEYKLEFYRDLAFIVVFKEETDNEENVIDNCCELKLVENGLYQIISIDGETLGKIETDYPKKIQLQKSLIESLEKGELFKHGQ